jgi:uncharacterized protein
MSDNDVHHLLLYTYVGDIAERRGPYREAHLGRIQSEKAAGRIVMAGALGDPVSGGAIAWRGVTPEHIEQFAAGDPYQEAGLIVAHRVERWNLV